MLNFIFLLKIKVELKNEKMKKTILLFASFLIMKIGVAQTNEDTTKLNSNLTFRTSFLTNTLGYEKVFTNNFSLNTEVGFTTGSFGFQTNPFSNVQYSTYLGVKLESRYYYNMERRIVKNKNTKNNSFNYLGFAINYSSPIKYYLGQNTDFSFHRSNVSPNGQLLFTPKWVMKRNLVGNIGIEFGVGASVVTDFKNVGFLPNLTLNLNYRFK